MGGEEPATAADLESRSVAEGDPIVSNPLLLGFFADLSAATVDRLSVDELHHVSQRKGWTREVTEAIAMLNGLHSIKAAATAVDPADNADDAWHVIDLCCGKSHVSALVGVLHPAMLVTAVDRMDPKFLPHYREAGLHNVQYAQLDVLAPSFAAKVESLIRLGRRRRVVVLGMHLCGLLSLAAINTFHALGAVHALVLAPCCLPSKSDGADTPAAVYMPRDPAGKFAVWCDFLQEKLRGNFQPEQLRGHSLTGAPSGARSEATPVGGGGVGAVGKGVSNVGCGVGDGEGVASSDPPESVGVLTPRPPDEYVVQSEAVEGIISVKRVLVTATRRAPMQLQREQQPEEAHATLSGLCISCDSSEHCEG